MTMKTRPSNVPVCYGQVRTRGCVQEWYETASRDAGRRARSLRQAGFCVAVECMGSQVTNIGRVRMTLLTVILSELEDHERFMSHGDVRIVRGV